jgi:hypothetical protein
LILVQTFRFVSSAMRLTTFMTTIRVCPLKSPKVRNPICKGNRTSADSLGHTADVWGSRGREFKSRQPDSESPHFIGFSGVLRGPVIRDGIECSQPCSQLAIETENGATRIMTWLEQLHAYMARTDHGLSERCRSCRGRVVVHPG